MDDDSPMDALARPLVPDPACIRLAMLGLVDGNGHPWSWSAIINGFEPEAMAACPYPVIPRYLAAQPERAFGIGGAKVTHLWTDDPGEAPKIARAARIPHVVARPEEVIGQVDAVIIATDIGGEHVERARPFIEAGLPVFIDKPLTDNRDGLAQFSRWAAEGRPILSSSSMRYAKELMPYHRGASREFGELRFVTSATPKKWETYGIHALEAVYPILGPGFLTARNTGAYERNIVHLTHRSGADLVIAASADMFGGFGKIQLLGTAGCAFIETRDTFDSFKSQLAAFIGYLATGVRPFPFSETAELMKIVIAGIESRERGGELVQIEDIPG